jgi:hypothetical protein
MRIGQIVGALLEVERLDQALADCASRGWPCSPRPLPRERAFDLGRADLAGAPSASVGDSAALTLVEGSAGHRRPSGWLELKTTDRGLPSGASLACESPLEALGWYRGLGLAGTARQETLGAVLVDLPGGQWLRFVDQANSPSRANWRPLVISFARLDAQGRRPPGLRPRVLAGSEGEGIELL